MRSDWLEIFCFNSLLIKTNECAHAQSSCLQLIRRPFCFVEVYL